MKKTVTILLLIFFTGTAISQPQVRAVEDTKDHYFNFTDLGERNGTITYGSGTSRYGRVVEETRIQENTDFQLCMAESANVTFNAWMGSAKEMHSSNRGFENSTTERCFDWNINSSHVENSKIRFSIWSRDEDKDYAHSNRSKSDFYIGLRYENVTVVDKEKRREAGIIQTVASFLTGLF